MPNIRKELHEIYHPAIAGIRRLPKPVVAAVNGPAVGIGCSLALACDLVLAAESSFFGLAFVARNHRKAGAKIAMRERDTGIIRRGHDRRNAGHDFKRNFRRGEFLGFLAATAENVRVAALEPHDGVAFLCFGHQQLVQFALRNGMVF